MDVEVLEYPRGGAPRRGAVRFTMDAQGVPLVVDVRLSQDRAGATQAKPWEVRGINVERGDGGPMTSTLIRRVPVNELLTQSISAFSGDRPTITSARLDELRDAGARGLSEKTLRLVAKVYEEVVLQQGNPVQEIVDAFGISRSTATRWVRRARDVGFIEALESERAELAALSLNVEMAAAAQRRAVDGPDRANDARMAEMAQESARLMELRAKKMRDEDDTEA